MSTSQSKPVLPTYGRHGEGHEANVLAEAWLRKWADHASFCAGLAEPSCPCGLNQTLAALRAAIAKATSA